MRLSLVSFTYLLVHLWRWKVALESTYRSLKQYKVLNSTPQSPATVKMAFVFCYHHSLAILSAGEAVHSSTENKHLLNATVTNYSSCRHCSIHDCKCLAPAVLPANPLNNCHLNIIPSVMLLTWLGCSCFSYKLWFYLYKHNKTQKAFMFLTKTFAWVRSLTRSSDARACALRKSSRSYSLVRFSSRGSLVLP